MHVSRLLNITQANYKKNLERKNQNLSETTTKNMETQHLQLSKHQSFSSADPSGPQNILTEFQLRLRAPI
jgi:hypothetical protein